MGCCFSDSKSTAEITHIKRSYIIVKPPTQHRLYKRRQSYYANAKSTQQPDQKETIRHSKSTETIPLPNLETWVTDSPSL